MTTLQIETPRAFVPLLSPRRYKGAKGGRGGAKSHFFAELLIEELVSQHTRAVCAREVQNSIDDSSKALLEKKLAKLGVSDLFRITDHEISGGPYDSLVIFKGLRKHTTSSIKSLEGFNRCWTDEAQTISQSSLDMVTPTFRTPGSELWFSWNPKSAKDPIDKLFLENTGDPDFICCKINYYDNPWFPPDLRKDMERDKARDPDKYAHIWLGEYERNSETRVFRNWKVESFETPADARFYFGADWGFAVDPTVLVRCFIKDRTLFVDAEAYQVGCEIDRTPALFAKTPEGVTNWRPQDWQITADSARPETIDYMQRHGFPRITHALKGPSSVMDGIEFLKSYDIVVHPRCRYLADELALYSFKTDKLTNEILPVLEDKKNHVIDALRYALESLRRAVSSSVKPLRL